MTRAASSDSIALEGLNRVGEHPKGSDFKLKNLFDTEEWSAFDPVERRVAGKKFKKGMARLDESASRGSDTANHQHYELS